MNSDRRASPSDRAVRYRCTWLWSAPKYEQNRNSAAIVPDQNVYWLVMSNEKSKLLRRPVAAATANPSPTLTPSGRPSSAATMMANKPPTMRVIVLTSVQVTAWTPPNIAYSTAGIAITSDVAARLHPSTSDSTTAGAEMIAPTARLREIRNRKLVKLRVLASNRPSRYSYAV